MSKTILRLEDPQFVEKLTELLERAETTPTPTAPPTKQRHQDYLSKLEASLLQLRAEGVFDNVRVSAPLEIKRVWVSCWTTQELNRDYLLGTTIAPLGLKGEWVVNTYAMYLPVMFMSAATRRIFDLMFSRRGYDGLVARRFFTHILSSWCADPFGHIDQSDVTRKGRKSSASVVAAHERSLLESPRDDELPLPEDLCSSFSEVSLEPEQVLDLWSYLSGAYSHYSRSHLKFTKSHVAQLLVPRSIYAADPDFCIHDPQLLGASIL